MSVMLVSRAASFDYYSNRLMDANNRLIELVCK